MGRERRVDRRGNATAQNRFEVDLTSVCIRRGALQLPYRLKDAFSEGPVAAVDADGHGALELAFRPPRELIGLRPFFEAHALRANDRIALVFESEGLRVHAMRRERTSAPASGGRGASGPPPSAGRDRSAPPGKGSPGGAPGASRPASSSTEGDDPMPHSAASQTPPSLRMEVPTASVPASEGSTTTPQRSPRTPQWEPLDVMMTGGDDAELGTDASAPGQPERTTGAAMVREVRRGSQWPPDDGATAAPSAAPPPAPPAAERQPSLWRDRRSAGGDVEEDDVGSGLFGLGRRLGLGRSGDRGAGRGARRGGRGAAARPPATEGQAPAAASGLWGVPLDGGAERHNDSERPVRTAAPDMARPAGAREPDSATDPEARPAAPSERAIAVEEPSREAETASQDMAAVRSYLSDPEVPAIVRTERVAEALAISVPRAEQALDRVSEESEQLSRIRPGAYMLRRRGPD